MEECSFPLKRRANALNFHGLLGMTAAMVLLGQEGP